MSGDTKACEAELARARPLSAGLWSLLGWLRRDDRCSSSDSLSSAGSDRTAVSFAFLAPPPPRNRISPLPPPLAPSTDSYNRRVRDRDLRRQYDRDLTLHRKYGLYYGYDAFSLPPAHKDLGIDRNRERRAISESLPRRIAHVPGKRRAPAPPERSHSIASSSSLTRRHSRKRAAPKPPVKCLENCKENNQTGVLENSDYSIRMNSESDHHRRPLSYLNTPNAYKSEKYTTKQNDTKDIKIRTEKSFLRQIFDGKKRNSTVDTVPERILPSISELDKEAAEIVESRKLKSVERNNNLTEMAPPQAENWFCTRCLRKYDSKIVTCQHCLPEQKRLSGWFIKDSSKNVASTTSNTCTQTEKEVVNAASSSRVIGIGADEKQKLKEMLKEMKDSLPKKHKSNNNDNVKNNNVYTFKEKDNKSLLMETPTLRIGSIDKDDMSVVPSQPSTSKQNSDVENSKGFDIPNIRQIPNLIPEPMTEKVVITQHVVLVAPQTKKDSKLNITKINSSENKAPQHNSSINTHILKDEDKSHIIQSNIANIERNNIHEPLKISSLLNPVYIPKTNTDLKRSSFLNPVGTGVNAPRTNNSVIPVTSTVLSSQTITTPAGASISKLNENPLVANQVKLKSENQKQIKINKDLPTEKQNIKKEIPTPNALAAVPTTSSTPPSTTSNTSSDKTKNINSNMVKFTVDQHSRRRDLINQLEQSIAKGDERAAADAAVKLAQLRLSCSVLSFSSQIMAQTFKNKPPEENKHDTPTSSKVNVAVVQSSAAPLKKVQVKTKVTAVNNDKQESQVTTSSQNKANYVLNNTSEDNADILRKSTSPRASTSTQSIKNGGNLATIQVWVEDREATRGPVNLRISRQAVMGELRREAETSLGLVGALQRWIVGRALCTDDQTPLVSLAGPNLSAPFYLCVVASENNENSPDKTELTPHNNKTDEVVDSKKSGGGDVYLELVQLEHRALVVNTESLECGVCMEECAAGGGAVLRECVHTFCRDCLSDLVRHCEEPQVSCPAIGCPGTLQEREIRSLVTPEEYERWLARSLAAAESGTRNAFHCRTRDCTGWALCDPGVRRFPCPVCKHTNCVPCQAIHESETCEQHRARIQEISSSATSGQTDEGTRVLLDTLIKKGEALECPECSAIITKKWGCDWVKCSACKTEICWITRGRRWGPGGKGDTSGGCRCGVDGKRCHPSCGYCH